MSICPITYENISGSKYSEKGLNKLSPHLKKLTNFPYSVEEQIREAAQRAAKLSIQGVQPKLSAKLNIKDSTFELVDQRGRYILKPQNQIYERLPENEDLTMRLAEAVGIEVPLHGLLYCEDKTFTYFIKRFDRFGHKRKIHVEDFAQLAGRTRETKYDSSMENVAEIIEQMTTFPQVEKLKLLSLLMFSFIIGNEDLHLKNFTLISDNGVVQLSPAYDLVNSTIALGKSATEELALPLNGKKNRLKEADIFDYYASKRLGLNNKVINATKVRFLDAQSIWLNLIERSFMTSKQKEDYKKLITKRINRLKMNN